jgi:hypothetical protein
VASALSNTYDQGRECSIQLVQWGRSWPDKARDVIDWHFREVPKLAANVGVSEAEKQTVKPRENA